MKARNIDIVKHIESYCMDIKNTVRRFGRDQTLFENDVDYRNSVCMSLLQIGELTGHLSGEFREATKESVYWPAIKGMRNVFAHDYGAIDYDRVWDTVEEDVPVLLEFCQKTIVLYNVAEQEEAIDDNRET